MSKQPEMTRQTKLTKTQRRDAMIGKIFISIIGMIFVFIGSAIVFRQIFPAPIVVGITVTFCMLFAWFIFKCDPRIITTKKLNQLQCDERDAFDAKDPRNYYNLASPYCIKKDPFE